MHKLLFSILILFSFKAHCVTKRILFLGNSYTYVNDLPNTLKNIALSFNDSLVVDSYAPGGYTLNAMSNDANAMNKIKLGNWDFIVIQAQSQEPSFDPSQVATDTYPYAKKLCDSIKQYNSCGEILFYMTWGRKNGDASNCPFYPPICTYTGMQQRLRESYLEMSDSNNATCVPVGIAWKNVRTQQPSIELYNADESHPSIHGTYLAACVFYTSIYHKYATGSTYITSGISALDANNLQLIASNTVIDSIETWQQYGHLPKTSFTTTNTFNNYTFTNNTLRGNTYTWYFGDGNTSTLTNPSHTYLSTGNYFAKLVTTSATCKTDSSTKSLFISVGVNDKAITSEQISYQNHSLIFKNMKQKFTLIVYDIEGKTVYLKNVNNTDERIDLTQIKNGLYTYKIQYQQSKETFGSKFLIQ